MYLVVSKCWGEFSTKKWPKDMLEGMTWEWGQLNILNLILVILLIGIPTRLNTLYLSSFYPLQFHYLYISIKEEEGGGGF